MLKKFVGAGAHGLMKISPPRVLYPPDAHRSQTPRPAHRRVPAPAACWFAAQFRAPAEPLAIRLWGAACMSASGSFETIESFMDFLLLLAIAARGRCCQTIAKNRRVIDRHRENS